MTYIRGFFKALIRRKPLEVDLEETKLNRCLSTLDLTALGIGSTLGLGIYVLAGQVASVKAGPAVTISFFIAAVASVFAGLCYAEFGARVPRAGSAYVYSYVTVGELMAFIIGWNLILEYVIGTASVARGYSGYIDSLFNGTMQKHLEQIMPIHIQHVSDYPDFLAFGITILLAIMLAAGVRESSRFNNVFTAVNLSVVMFAIIAGSIKADFHNWKLTESEVPKHAGSGGFMPYGFSGMMSGAATCFYGFIGFDCIATTGEEVRNPQKSIPISIVLSLLFVFLAYFGVSTVQTMMMPYYLQDNPAPLPYVFDYVGWPVCRWIVSIGALAGLSTSLLGCIFPLPRVLYAMGSDGIIFRFLAKVHPRYQTPLIATAVSGVFAGLMAMMFNVQELADMMSIGTLLAYSLVAVSVTILRYSCDDGAENSVNKPRYSSVAQSPEKRGWENDSRMKSSSITGSLALPLEKLTYNAVVRQLFNIDRLQKPNKLTSKISIWLIGITCILICAMDVQLAVYEEEIMRFDIRPLTILAVNIALILICIIMLQRQPVDQKKLSFKVPLVPIIPMLSVAINAYLMCKLSILTWKRFGVWMILGFCVYFFYGIWNSSERKQNKGAASVYTVDGGETQLVDRSDVLSTSTLQPGKSSVESNMSELMSSCNSAEASLISNHPTNGTIK